MATLDDLEKRKFDKDGRVKVAASESYFLQDYEEGTPVSYSGLNSKSGNYLIKKIDQTSGMKLTYASKINNPSYANYSNAWTARYSLVYGDAEGI